MFKVAVAACPNWLKVIGYSLCVFRIGTLLKPQDDAKTMHTNEQLDNSVLKQTESETKGSKLFRLSCLVAA